MDGELGLLGDFEFFGELLALAVGVPLLIFAAARTWRLRAHRRRMAERDAERRRPLPPPQPAPAPASDPRLPITPLASDQRRSFGDRWLDRENSGRVIGG